MRARLMALALAAALLLTGCGNADNPTADTDRDTTPTAPVTQAPQATQFSLPYYPDADLHPITGNHRSNLAVSALVYQGLFELDNTFEPHEVLCSGYTVSEDGLTWSFTLGEAFFSDGSPVTAADAAASLELARTAPLYAERLRDVQRIAAQADGTVTLTLSRPNGALPALLDIPVVREIADGALPLGTGPYRFVQTGDELSLIRMDGAPATAPGEIPLVPIETADELIYAFDAGRISLVIGDMTGANALGYSTGYEVFSYPTTTMLYVGFQTRRGPCQDAQVRQAVSRSFDRDTVTTSLLAGYGQATCLPFSPSCTLHSSIHERIGAFDPADAQALLAQAGYSKEEDGLLYRNRTALSLSFVVNTDNAFKLAVAEYLAEQLSAAGITVELNKLAWEDYLAALNAGQFDLYLGEVSLTADFDLSPLLSAEGALNYGGFSSPEVELLLEQLRTARGAERTSIAGNLLDQLQPQAALAPLCFKNHSVLTRWKTVSGLEPTRQNPFYNMESLRFNADK